MTATTLDSREAKIDEYVILDAQDRLLEFVSELAFEDGGTAAIRIPDLSDKLLSELWPQGEDDDGSYPADWCDAERRSGWVAAKLLVALTTSDAQDALEAEAIRLAGLAAGDTGEAEK